MLRKSCVVALFLSLVAWCSGTTFDNNSEADVFLANGAGYWSQGGVGNNTLSSSMNFTGRASQYAIGDADGDGLADMFVGNYLGNPGLEWLESDGMGGFVSKMGWVQGGAIKSIGLGDTRLGASKKLYVVNTNGSVDWFNVTGDSGLGYLGVYSTGAAGFTARDYDGDGKEEEILWRSNGTIEIYSGYVGWYKEMSISNAAITDVALGNFTGVGRDMFVVNNGYVNWYKLVGQDAPEFLSTFGDGTAKSAAIGDVDGDGVVELLIGRTGAGLAWYEATSSTALMSVSGDGLLNDVSSIAIVVPEPCTLVLMAVATGLSLIKKRLSK